MKVAVIGASGLIGSALVEHLLDRDDVETRAVVHNCGNAWRLIRAAVPMKTADIASRSEASAALEGCTHVVNCTLGPTDVMLTGLKNLLAASKAQKVRRFVHLSSVAVYGEPPPPESEREDAPPNPRPGSYGATKLQQDRLVAEAVASGLDCVVLCPPNVSGPYSRFVCTVLADLRRGSLALADGGSRRLSVVDVENLVHAISLALEAPKTDGKRIFISDAVGLTWKGLSDALVPLLEGAPIPLIPASALSGLRVEAARPASLWRSMKHLVSLDVREALRRDPLLARFDATMRRLAGLGGEAAKERLRRSIVGPREIAKVHDVNPNWSYCTNVMQQGDVWHRIDRARDLLGYEPPISFADSMARFRLWYETMHGFGQPYWPLARTLDRFVTTTPSLP